MTDHLFDERTAYREMEWRPIETAPRDGTPILIFRRCQGWNVVGWATWADVRGIAGWLSYGFGEVPGNLGLADPSHWMPLPEPPRNEVKP